ncbi:MAG TPA: DNA mismatch repair protein MutL, partial [Roseiflexaceae bacterium]|nr:DNA mismatch repair protein MutL [Roseiflexaceae bacterium]
GVGDPGMERPETNTAWEWTESEMPLGSRSLGGMDTLVPDPQPLTPNPWPPATDAKLPPLRVVGQVGLTYIVAEGPDGMYLVDQHAAHERVTYERLMAARGAGAIERQGLLIPQTVELPPATHELLLGNAAALEEWGFTLEDFGAGVRVRSVPAGLRDADLAEPLAEIADHLAGRGGSTPVDWRETMLTTLACHSSVRAGQALSLEEMRDLLGQLERCQAPRTCPHGRPTMIYLGLGQLERQFGRTK